MMTTFHKWVLILLSVIAAALVVSNLSGCTIIDYGNFHYRSFGGKSFDSLEGVKDGNDVLVEVRNYKQENVADIAGSVAKGVAEGLK